MWYLTKPTQPVERPRRKQIIVLRLLILIGLGGMAMFLHGILNSDYAGFSPLYYALLVSFLFFCLKSLHEWYHYWGITRPETPALKQDFSVDVLTTFVPGEPYEMIVGTLEAIQNIEYPHTTYLCDEGDDPYLREQCQRLGVVHVTREEKINAKAGNINNALEQASGDICLILDPDHIPAPSFLHRVLPHFQDPEVGFVQVVQGYNNINENIITKGSAQQTFQFYGPMMMSMHRYGTAQAIGANCSFRRSALDSIGGHAPGLAEDMNTSMQLHAKAWRSVYLPEVLTRGLVPSSISAYYQQQLKWSRGVFELLLTTYPRHFRKFSWRQKLHYGLLPGHYASCLIYLINFTIPVISLLLGVTPMRMGLDHFALIALPFIGSTLLIRHYVQRWVMDEEERGFHLVGGILLIGTWWIHLMGIIFTFLRRKVPYTPTPKDDKEENILGLNLPNMAVMAVSIFAISYGLYRDFNPYNLAMAGFAFLNIMLLGVMFLISYQNKYRRFKKKYPAMQTLSVFIWQGKRLFWLFRHRVYGLLRYLALPLLLLLIGGLYYSTSTRSLEDIQPLDPPQVPTSYYSGFHWPLSLRALPQIPASDHPIVTIPLAAGDSSALQEALEKVDQLHEAGAYPLLHWQAVVPDEESPKGRDLCHAVLSGQMAPFLNQLGAALDSRRQPVFLSFDPFGDHSPLPSDSAFRAAWQHLYSQLGPQQLPQIIWVYPVRHPYEVDSYFPGAQRVDWLSLRWPDSLKAQPKSFARFYGPVKRSHSLSHQIPVMLQNVPGSFNDASDAQGNAVLSETLRRENPHIQALVYNEPASFQAAQTSGWKWSKNTSPPLILDRLPESAPGKGQPSSVYAGLHGVNYRKGQDWQASTHPLYRRTVREDFEAMRELNLGWIKRVGPGVYDQNILRAAESQNLKVMYGLWPERKRDMLDTAHWHQLQRSWLNTLRKKQSSKAIKAWHLGPPIWNELASLYAAPQLYEQRRAYWNWLQSTVRALKAIDPDRPVSISLQANEDLNIALRELQAHVPEIDAVGLNIGEKGLTEELREMILAQDKFLFVNDIKNIKDGFWLREKLPGFWPSWQDEIFRNSISIQGILSEGGQPKLAHYQAQSGQRGSLPHLKILRPGLFPHQGKRLQYRLLEKADSGWLILDDAELPTPPQWYLIKKDDYGNLLAKEKVGQGFSIWVEAPADAQHYMLYAEVPGDPYWRQTSMELAPPLQIGPEQKPLSAGQARYLFREQKMPPEMDRMTP